MKSNFYLFGSYILAFSLICLLSSHASSQVSKNTKRVVIVLTESWQAPSGKLYCMEQKNGGWQKYSDWRVTVGRNGLGWGRGLLPITAKKPNKREGDGKAPAGIFRIRKKLYGYAKKPVIKTSWPYQQLTQSLVGVDDPHSSYYNQILDEAKIQHHDWNSCERMRRKDDLYQWLLMVEHNTNPSFPGAGSCIFIHIWRGPNFPTAGCTAMSKENLLKLAQWLGKKDTPILVQLPRSVYQIYQKKFQLPRLKELANNE